MLINPQITLMTSNHATADRKACAHLKGLGHAILRNFV